MLEMEHRFWLIVKVLCLFAMHQINCESSATVTLEEGSVSGVKYLSRNGREYYAFLGIPYAEPPVGDLRFENPVPKKPWRSNLQADKDPPMCAQLKDGKFVGSEDCLYLNVYTPRISNATEGQDAGYPVVFYIPGGAFLFGDGHFTHWNPKFVMDKDIVLVVIQYRIGLAGFFATGDNVAPGNYGLKDQVLALQWVHSHIKNFFGDPQRITMVGHSAGGASVGAHAITNATKGLYHQYIQMSVTTYILWGFHKGRESDYLSVMKKAARKCGCPTDNSTEMVNCLKRTSIEDLVRAHSVFDEKNYIFLIPSPVVEPKSEHALLTESPADIIERDGTIDVPFMIGAVEKEGLYVTAPLYVNDEQYERAVNETNNRIQEYLEYFLSPEEAAVIVDDVKTYYFGNLPISDRETYIQRLSDFISDISFFYPNFLITERQAQSAKHPFYVYNFQYSSTLHSYYKSLGSYRNLGASHADDLTYIFLRNPATLGPPDATLSETDYRMVDIMVDLWTNFVITGKPTSDHMENPNAWTPYTSDRSYLRIGHYNDTSCVLQHNFRHEAMQFLKNIIASAHNRFHEL